MSNTDRLTRDIDAKFSINGRGEIVKPSNGEVLGHDEPLMLFRARDYLALPMLEHYREQSIADGCTDYHLDLLDSAIEKFKAFQVEHPERMKQPGITRGL
jgi:hypothetical protein